MKPITLKQLAEKCEAILKRYPEFAMLPVYGYDDGSINLDGYDDITTHTPDEIAEKRRNRVRK